MVSIADKPTSLREEQTRAALRYQNARTGRAREKALVALYEACGPLIAHLIEGERGRAIMAVHGYMKDDLRVKAFRGVWTAADRFDPARGHFGAFVRPYIIEAMDTADDDSKRLSRSEDAHGQRTRGQDGLDHLDLIGESDPDVEALTGEPEPAGTDSLVEAFGRLSVGTLSEKIREWGVKPDAHYLIPELGREMDLHRSDFTAVLSGPVGKDEDEIRSLLDLLGNKERDRGHTAAGLRRLNAMRAALHSDPDAFIGRIRFSRLRAEVATASVVRRFRHGTVEKLHIPLHVLYYLTQTGSDRGRAKAKHRTFLPAISDQKLGRLIGKDHKTAKALAARVTAARPVAQALTTDDLDHLADSLNPRRKKSTT